MTLEKYYLERHNIEIKDFNQPLIIVKVKGPQNKETSLYFIPELCYLSGLDDAATKDGYFMKQLANETKLTPKDRIKKTNEFLSLLKGTKKKTPDSLSSKDKSELYGIEIKALENMHKAYYMVETDLLGKNNKILTSKDKIFQVFKEKDFKKWVCFYKKENYYDADGFLKGLKKASKGYGIYVNDPKWCEMGDSSTIDEWIDSAEYYFGKGKNTYKFAVFLLYGNEEFYIDIKIHSLCTNGYVSQVVRIDSLYDKNDRISLSVCSKILLQINAKISGIIYKLNKTKEILDRKLMVIGVDSSHIRGKGTGVAMVSTLDENFTKFYNKESIIKQDKRDNLQFCISAFIENTLPKFEKENGQLPKGIIIYRQGVSLQQKDFLTREINNIYKIIKKYKILFYYILVNTKTTYKFFEKNDKGFSNPEGGLLIIDGITNRNFFEFYIQPQQVTGGSATPTCFHVAYGNLNFPEMIPKFTFDLCHLYSNWQWTIRVPNVLKGAEKLSKMTSKYTFEELNENLKIGQSYL